MHFPQLVSAAASIYHRKNLMTSQNLFLSLHQLFPNHFCYFYLSMGRPKHVRIMAGALEGDLFVGPKAEDHRGLLSIRYPMEHGIVNDWNDMERIWTHIYSKVSSRVKCIVKFTKEVNIFRMNSRHSPKNIPCC